MPNRRSNKNQQSDKKGKGSKDGKKTTAEAQKKNSKAEKEKNATDETKMTLCTIPTASVRPQVRERRPGRPPSGKRLAMARDMPAKVRSAFRRSLDPCDNSNDSGLGFDHHADHLHHHHLTNSDRLTWNGGDATGPGAIGAAAASAKRPKMDIKLEHDDDNNDRFTFPESMRTCKENTSLIRTAPIGSIPSLSMNNNQSSSSGRAVPRCVPLSNRQANSSPIPLTTQLTSCSKYATDLSLTIVKQPEQQHRARYQTEGSRGAVKDRDGNGFPIVQLLGYYQPATLQVFIGTDVGKVAPHMFYQACKVSGKNSTPCIEKKIEGTCVIELQLDPSKEMSAICDCVGILKERNVDVEHRFPDQLGNRSKKKSTRCRMIFRTTLTHEDGTVETLQVCSQPIVCTQPPGIPEICKKSLTSCPASGGLELFVLGKNFLKDTKVFFQQVDDDRHVRWEQAVIPDKEYLQQTHFVCVVPQYRRPDITEPVTVRLCVVSSGKTSEPHQFVYNPVNGAIPSVHVEHQQQSAVVPSPSTAQSQFFNKMMWPSSISKREQDLGMMPPPESSMVPIAPRRPSLSVPSTSDNLSPPLRNLKQEYIDENSQSSMCEPIEHMSERYRHLSEGSLDVHHSDSNMSLMNDNSIDMLSHGGIMNHSDNSNMSVANENSVEMIRRPSMSRCENSMDVTSQMSTMSEDTSSTVMHNSSIVTSSLLQQSLMATSASRTSSIAEDLKVMDLRMKMPMATVADLVSSNAPSLATLQSFGVTEPTQGPLPAQSAQSIENFLTNIESKNIPNDLQLKSEVNQIIQNSLNSPIMSSQPAAFLSSQQRAFSDTMHLVAKSEAAAIAEQTISEQTSAIASTITTMSTMSTTTLENAISLPINTEKLDQLVNSTVESHIGSPPTAKLSPTASPPVQNDVIRDVMLNGRSSLMVPPMINTTIASPMLNELPSAVILNSQISPSLMCRNTPDSAHLLPSTICQPSVTVVESSLQVPTTLLPPQNTQTAPITNSLQLVASTEPEKVVLLNAAADLFETQQKLSEMEQRNKTMESTKIMDEIITMATSTTTSDIATNRLSQLQGNNFQTPILNAQQQQQSTAQQVESATGDLLMQKTMAQQQQDIIPVPVKEIAGNDKKNDDRMIPQSFTALTENELINLINPSCFDQV